MQIFGMIEFICLRMSHMVRMFICHNYDIHLFLCQYNVDNGDSILGTFHVNGYLAAGANYTKSVNIRIPERIFGTFYILIFTDLYNQVYEHTNENDNVGSAIVRKSTSSCCMEYR